MNDQRREWIGSWIEAIGTVTSAIGSTPSKGVTEQVQYNLDLFGNVLQATGSALQANDQISLDGIGREIQAVGNTTVILGMLSTCNESTKEELIIKGNLLQATGAGILFSIELENQNNNPQQILLIIGNLLESIGNSLQAIGGKYKLEDYYKRDEKLKRKWESFNVIGNWIQAIGSILIAIGQTILLS